MLENIAFFPTKREKFTRLSTLKVRAGENLLRVPALLSGIVSKKNLKNVTPFALARPSVACQGANDPLARP